MQAAPNDGYPTAYRTLIPDDFLDGLRPEDRAQRYTFGSPDPRQPWTVVAEEAGVIHGFATTGPGRDSDLPDDGELYAIYVDPGQWGRGIGNALISAARARLRDLGFRQAALWVLAGNVLAERFYRLDGWAPDGVRRRQVSFLTGGRGPHSRFGEQGVGFGRRILPAPTTSTKFSWPPT